MKPWMTIIARALALLWAGFWSFFFVAESWAWGTPARVAVFWAGLGLLFVILALVPWGWEARGGVLLAAVGLLIGVVYAVWAPPRRSLASRVITTLVLSGPPLVAGTLFLMHYRAATERS